MTAIFQFISLEKTPTSTSGEFRNKLVSVGVQSPTEIKASGGLQECAYEDVSKADAHSAARTLGAFLNFVVRAEGTEMQVKQMAGNQMITCHFEYMLKHTFELSSSLAKVSGIAFRCKRNGAINMMWLCLEKNC